MKLLLHLGDLMSWLCSDKQQLPIRCRSHCTNSTWKSLLAIRAWLRGPIPCVSREEPQVQTALWTRHHRTLGVPGRTLQALRLALVTVIQ